MTLTQSEIIGCMKHLEISLERIERSVDECLATANRIEWQFFEFETLHLNFEL